MAHSKVKRTIKTSPETEKSPNVDFLRQTALFSTLTAAELQQVSGKIVVRNFKKGETILREEKTSEFMYIILDGAVKVVQFTDGGKEIIVSVHQSGDFFGELSLIDGKTAPATVCATKNSILAIISRNDFYSLLYSQSKVLDNLLKIFCARFRESMKKIQMLNFNNASQRIKMLFLMLSDSYGEIKPDGTILKIKLIHQDIADMTGLTRETVTRVLDKWQRSGEIKILKEKFILLCPEFESISF